MDPEIFFPERGDSADDAMRVCRTCPVQVECLEYGLRYEKRGVWGGASERERKRIRTKRGRATRAALCSDPA